MENGGELHVEISSDDSGEISIAVSDTGSGISPQHLNRVFDPYFTTKSTGTGLGLAIAHNIVEAIGGRIQVKSSSDRGTTFTVTLPNSKEGGSIEL
jgi:signal transduction histidine kinase